MTKEVNAHIEPVDNVANDLLRGAENIAEFLGITRRSVYYYAERGELPIFRLGNQLFARRSKLLQHISHLEENPCRTTRVDLVAELFG